MVIALLPPPNYYPSLLYPMSGLSQFEHVCLSFGQQGGQPMSLVALEVRLHQLRKEIHWDMKRDLYALYPAHISSCSHARDGP